MGEYIIEIVTILVYLGLAIWWISSCQKVWTTIAVFLILLGIGLVVVQLVKLVLIVGVFLLVIGVLLGGRRRERICIWFL